MAKNNKKKGKGKGKHKRRPSNQGPNESPKGEDETACSSPRKQKDLQHDKLPVNDSIAVDVLTSLGKTNDRSLKLEAEKDGVETDVNGTQSSIAEDTPKTEIIEKMSFMEGPAAEIEVHLAVEKILALTKQEHELNSDNSRLETEISELGARFEESTAEMKILREKMQDIVRESLSLKTSVPDEENKREKPKRRLRLLKKKLKQELEGKICMEDEIANIAGELHKKEAYVAALGNDFETLASTAIEIIEGIESLIRFNLEVVGGEAGDSESSRDRRLEMLLEELRKIYRQVGMMLSMEWFSESKETGREKQEKMDSFGDRLRKLQSQFGRDFAHVQMQLSGCAEDVQKEKAAIETLSQVKQELISGIDELMMELLDMDVVVFALQNILRVLGQNVDGKDGGVENHGNSD